MVSFKVEFCMEREREMGMDEEGNCSCDVLVWKPFGVDLIGVIRLIDKFDTDRGRDLASAKEAPTPFHLCCRIDSKSPGGSRLVIL